MLCPAHEGLLVEYSCVGTVLKDVRSAEKSLPLTVNYGILRVRSAQRITRLLKIHVLKVYYFPWNWEELYLKLLHQKAYWVGTMLSGS